MKTKQRSGRKVAVAMTNDEIEELFDVVHEFRHCKQYIELIMPKVATHVIEDLLSDGMSLRQLAQQIGRSPAYLSMVRNRHSDCSPETFMKLFEVWEKKKQQ